MNLSSLRAEFERLAAVLPPHCDTLTGRSVSAARPVIFQTLKSPDPDDLKEALKSTNPFCEGLLANAFLEDLHSKVDKTANTAPIVEAMLYGPYRRPAPRLHKFFHAEIEKYPKFPEYIKFLQKQIEEIFVLSQDVKGGIAYRPDIQARWANSVTARPLMGLEHL